MGTETFFEISPFVFGRREKVIQIRNNVRLIMFGWTISFRILLLYSIQSGCRDRKVTPTANQQSLTKVRFVWKDKQEKSLACLPTFVFAQLCLWSVMYFSYLSHVCLDLCLFACVFLLICLFGTASDGPYSSCVV